MTQTRYRVDGMDCVGCASKIDTAVRRVPGVTHVAVSVTAGTMTVHHDADSDLKSIERKVAGLGYQAALPTHDFRQNDDHTGHGHGAADHHGHDDKHARHAESEIAGLHGDDHGAMTGPWWRSKKGLLTIASGVALVVAYAAGKLVPPIASDAFVAAMLVGLVPIARRAFMAARAHAILD
jgi:Cd2+/Zn2+-exporting ATPase